MSISEVKDTISRGSQAAKAGKTTFENAMADATQVATLARQTIHDSIDGDAKAGIKALEAALNEIDQVVRRYDAASKYASNLG